MREIDQGGRGLEGDAYAEGLAVDLVCRCPSRGPCEGKNLQFSCFRGLESDAGP
jgi:hypothetical protein